MNTLVVLLGPTGVGKTDLCVRVAEAFRVPVINADSRQIFKEMPIGTAAPTPEQTARVRHYFVADHSVHDYYSASRYEEDVMRLLPEMFRTGKLALMSGGSMMYIDAVCNGIDDIPTVDDRTREELKERLRQEGLPALTEELRRLDPRHWEEVDRNNPRRVVHALEICLMTGRPYSSFRKHTVKQRPFRIVKIGLNRPREELYDRINRRVDRMMEEGLEEEARRLYPLKGLNALNTVGYKELFDAFDGKWNMAEAVERIKGNTRKYCRKQLTWFKRDGSIRWFHPDDEQEIITYMTQFVE